MNKLLETRRNKILAYNSKHDCSPLLFRDYRGLIKTIPKEELRFNNDGSPNRKRLVLSILSMSEHFDSVREDGTWETSPGRNRSSLDIWRHAKALYPDIDVFSIMETIHRLTKSGALFTQYCTTVHRSVTYLSDSRGRDIFTRDDEDLMWRCGDYNISFNTWRNLHE